MPKIRVNAFSVSHRRLRRRSGTEPRESPALPVRWTGGEGTSVADASSILATAAEEHNARPSAISDAPRIRLPVTA